MRADHGLSDRTLAQIRDVLVRFPEVEKATLFGSRAKGNPRRGSDIDLALVGPRLDWRAIGRIYDALDDLLLPYGFSLIQHDAATDPDVSAHIARVGVPLFDRPSSARGPSIGAGDKDVRSQPGASEPSPRSTS